MRYLKSFKTNSFLPVLCTPPVLHYQPILSKLSP